MSRLRIPVAPRLEMGYDGGFTELAIGDYQGRAHYRWWSNPPAGWYGLDRFARKICTIYAELRQLSMNRFGRNLPQFVASLPVVGMSHVPNIQALLEELPEDSEVELVREPGNPYDSNAIAVHLPEGENDSKGPRIGYVPRARNSRLAALLDNGARLKARIFDYTADRGSPAMDILVFDSRATGNKVLEPARNPDHACAGAATGLNGLEAKCVDCLRDGTDAALREVSPEDVRDDLLKRLRGYETVVHTNAEADESYRDLEDGSYTVEVKNPAVGGEPLFLEIAGDFTIFFGGWHAHYSSYLMDYEQHFVRDFTAILADEMCAVAAYDGKGQWYGSSPAQPPLTREEGLRAALRCLALPREHLEKLKPGGLIKVGYWSPERSFELPL